MRLSIGGAPVRSSSRRSDSRRRTDSPSTSFPPTSAASTGHGGEITPRRLRWDMTSTSPPSTSSSRTARSQTSRRTLPAEGRDPAPLTGEPRSTRCLSTNRFPVNRWQGPSSWAALSVLFWKEVEHRGCGGGLPQPAHSEQLLDRRQQLVMVVSYVAHEVGEARGDDHGEHMVVAAAVIFVPGHDQHSVVL